MAQKGKLQKWIKLKRNWINCELRMKIMKMEEVYDQIGVFFGCFGRKLNCIVGVFRKLKFKVNRRKVDENSLSISKKWPTSESFNLIYFKIRKWIKI